MAKLYFKYGAMGSSKTAQALITKYNYEENDLNVWLIKPGTDTRDGETILRSRIGLQSPAEVIAPGTDIYRLFQDTQAGRCDVVIVDECQFLTEQQIDQLRALVNDYNLPVMCFGLRTDFQTRLFPGSAGKYRQWEESPRSGQRRWCSSPVPCLFPPGHAEFHR